MKKIVSLFSLLLPLVSNCMDNSSILNISASTSLNLFYVVTLGLSAILFLYLRSLWKKQIPEIFFWIHFFIVSWSALMYLNLVFDTSLKAFTWYADWIVSTPLIMLALGLTAMYPLKNIKNDTLFALMMAQVMVVVTGILAQLCPTKTGMLTYFSLGNVIMLLVFYLVFGPLMTIASQNKQIYQKYKILSYLFGIFWISYPFVWIIGTPGYGFISPFTTNVLFVVLPILCKPVFGMVDLFLLQSLKSED